MEAKRSHRAAVGAIAEKEYIKIWIFLGGEVLIVFDCSQTCLFEMEIKCLVLFTVLKLFGHLALIIFLEEK